jgi:hypothetical protein
METFRWPLAILLLWHPLGYALLSSVPRRPKRPRHLASLWGGLHLADHIPIMVQNFAWGVGQPDSYLEAFCGPSYSMILWYSRIVYY